MSNFKKGIISISIDDGRKDAYRLVKEVLPRYNIPATFNITTAFVDKENKGNTGSVTQSELKEMYNSPLVEIACHGHAHKNDDEDITRGRSLLYEWLGIKDESIGFASPGSGIKNDCINENEQHFKDLGLLYIRTGKSNLPKTKSQQKLQEDLKNNGVTAFAAENVQQLIEGFDGMCVNSVPVLNFHTLDELKALTSLAQNQKACVVLMFHSIAKKGEYKPDDLWSYDFDKFSAFLEYLAQKRDNGEIEILTTREVFLRGGQQ